MNYNNDYGDNFDDAISDELNDYGINVASDDNVDTPGVLYQHYQHSDGSASGGNVNVLR